MIQERVYSANEYADARDHVHELEVEVERLKVELADWHSSASQIMAEPCRDNEVHCTCVPALRKEIERLNDFLEREGFRRCDIAACNCDSWHGGHAMVRLQEIIETLGGCNGTTPLAEVEQLKAELEDEHEIAENYHRQHSCADCGKLVCPPLRCMQCLASDERNATLEAEVERLKAQIARMEHDGQGDPEEYVQELEAEIKRLGTRLHTTDGEWARRCRVIGRELEKSRAAVTKLGRRLGCMRKRRKRELAESEQAKRCVLWMKDVMRKAAGLLTRVRDMDAIAAYNCIDLALHNLAIREKQQLAERENP